MQTRSIIGIHKGDVKGTGSEANVYDMKDGYYKKFKCFVSKDERIGKRRKLLYLEQFEHLKKYYPKIYYLVSSCFSKRRIKGYVMEPVFGHHINSDKFSFEEKIFLLSLLRRIIESFNEVGIYYHDIRIPNLVVKEEKDIVLLDIDSIVTKEDMEMDVVPCALKDYMSVGGTIGTGAQTIMFNNLTGKVLRNEIEDDEHFIVDKDGQRIEDDIALDKVDCAADHEYFYEHIKRLK